MWGGITQKHNFSRLFIIIQKRMSLRSEWSSMESPKIKKKIFETSHSDAVSAKVKLFVSLLSQIWRFTSSSVMLSFEKVISQIWNHTQFLATNGFAVMLLKSGKQWEERRIQTLSQSYSKEGLAADWRKFCAAHLEFKNHQQKISGWWQIHVVSFAY